MKATDIVREVMGKQGVKPSMLASKLNIKNNVLSERLGQKNISITKLNEMLDVLHHKMIVVPDDYVVPEDGFEIDKGE